MEDVYASPEDEEVANFMRVLGELSYQNSRYRLPFRTWANMDPRAKQRFIQHTYKMAEKGLPFHEEIVRRIVARKLTDV